MYHGLSRRFLDTISRVYVLVLYFLDFQILGAWVPLATRSLTFSLLGFYEAKQHLWNMFCVFDVYLVFFL